MDKHRAGCIPPKPTDTEEPNDKVRAELSSVLSVDVYERMCALYAYRFGTIGFLDLVTKFEEILVSNLLKLMYRVLPLHHISCGRGKLMPRTFLSLPIVAFKSDVLVSVGL